MIVYTDGGYDKNGAYGSARIENDDGTLWKMIRWGFPYPVKTNNEAEYATLLETLLYLSSMTDFRFLKVYSDSELMIRQLTRVYKIKAENLREFAERIWEVSEDFDKIEYEHVPREVLVEKVGH